MIQLGEVRLMEQGKINIPKKVREKLNLQKGDKILFLEDEKGKIVL